MLKMHLVAKVPNEGARRLAWWIKSRDAADAASRLERLAGVDEIKAARLLAGEILPGGEMGHFIMHATDGLVLLRHWREAPRAGWFTRPEGFQEQEARGVLPPSLARVGGAYAPSASPTPVQQARA